MPSKLRRKLRKLVLNPGTFFKDALSNRMKDMVKISPPMPRMTEHLLATSLLQGDRSPDGTPGNRVYILTSIPFWRARLGNQCRILELAQHLRERRDLTVVFTGLLNVGDAKEILAKGWAPHVRCLITPTNTFLYEKDLRDQSVSNGAIFASANRFKEFMETHPCHALIVEYITHEPYVRNLDTGCLKIIDTHDVMSLRMQAFANHGRGHHIQISEAEELHWLGTFDKVVAIQKEEYDFLAKKLGPEKVILAHHALRPQSCFKDREPKRLIYLAGRSPANLDSIEWLLKRVLPLIEHLPVEIHLYGAICGVIPTRLTQNPRIILHGEIENQIDAYSAGDIVLNPVLYGGGLKIKTVEAMAHGLPLVTTDEGARGLSDIANKCFLVANSPEEFARSIIRLCEDKSLRKSLSDASLLHVGIHFSAEQCFKDIVTAIDRHSARSGATSKVDACPDNPERTLILGRRDFPLIAGVQGALQKYPHAMYIPAADINDVEHFKRIISEKCIDRVLITNPYISEKHLDLYEYSREAGLPVTTFDRGALPDSWFFDNKGFNGDSPSYAPENWDRPLPSARRERARTYIDRLFEEGKTLEKQGGRMDTRELRRRLNLGNRKVLFVALQRPNDTVVKYLSGNLKGMPGFVKFVNDVVEALDPREWAVVYKRHPLERDEPPIWAQPTHPDTHIHDLIQMSDATLIINSGVGVLSLLAGKPTFTCGQSFYSHKGLAENVTSPAELVRKLGSLVPPNREKTERFLSYLLEDFYSFGTASGYLRTEQGGELSPITTRIDFTQIRGITPLKEEKNAAARLALLRWQEAGSEPSQAFDMQERVPS